MARPNRGLGSMFLVTSVSLLLSACGLLSEGGAGYELRSGAGEPLPAILYEGVITDATGTWELRIDAVGGTLRLRDGRYEHRLTLVSYIDGQLAGRNPWSDRGIYSDANGNLQFESEVVENFSFTGSRGARSMILQHDLYLLLGEHFHVPLEYGR